MLIGRTGVGAEADSNPAALLLLFQGERRREPLKIKGDEELDRVAHTDTDSSRDPD